MRGAIPLLAIVILALPPIAQGDFQTGLAAARQGDFDTAHREWLPLAEQGSPDAQDNMGLLYAQGLGVPRDYTKALRWFRMAAVQRHAGAQYNLGYAYSKGYGVAQDDTKALSWFRMSAEQGHPRAQSNLGLHYEHGRGIDKDAVQAYAWYHLAASRGSSTAEKNTQRLRALMSPPEIARAERLSRALIPP